MRTLKSYAFLCFLAILFASKTVGSQPYRILDKDDEFDWLQTARVFLMDAYQPPLAPELEYDANAVAETMEEMNANVIRFATMGKYATIQEVRFFVHPDQGDRDLLQETIDACKPKGIRVVPYISTGHILAWSMVTRDYPEYAQKVIPNGMPNRTHKHVGEDHGTVCWMTPYKEAFMDLLKHVVRDYDIDGVYFDSWTQPHYSWPYLQICYCDSCHLRFREATGLDLPYNTNYLPYTFINNDPFSGVNSNRGDDFTDDERKIIDRYHEWFYKEYVKIAREAAEMIRSYKDIPLITNIGDPKRMAGMDARIINAMDGFLYEGEKSLLERAEGVGVPRSLGLHGWPYIGDTHNWPRLTMGGVSYQQQIFTNLMFGAGSIIALPTGYLYRTDNRGFVSYPFGVIKEHEKIFNGLENVPYVGVVFAYDSPPEHNKTSSHEGVTNARTSTSGAFAACLYNHVQVGSISEFVMDDPDKLKKYPVLYLANIPHLSKERIKNITDYVNNGGCLVASYDVSLFDSNGNRQPRFGLEGLIKVRPISPSKKLTDMMNSYTCTYKGPNDLYLLATNKNSPAVSAKWQDKFYPLWFYEPVEVLEGGKVLMDIVTGPDRKAILPGVVMSEYGKGKVIYCSSALESLYGNGGYDMIGELIRDFVDIVAPEPAPFTMEASASLIANLTEKESMMVLHLTNWSGNKFEHPNEYSQLPIENVRLKIHIPEEKKVKNVFTLIETEYEKNITEKNLEVFFPRVDAYQGVVVELE